MYCKMKKDKQYYESLDKRTKEYKEYKSQGLGDTVEKIIKATGLDKLAPEDCGCEERKEYLNNLFRYRLKPQRCLTDTERTEVNNMPLNRLEYSQAVYVMKLYSDVFKTRYVKPCASCSPKIINNALKDLKKL